MDIIDIQLKTAKKVNHSVESPAWMQDRDFMRIVLAGMPAVYERYSDPKNRAKGEPPDSLDASISLYEQELLELHEAYVEYDYAAGLGYPASVDKVRYELGDVVLCAIYALASKEVQG